MVDAGIFLRETERYGTPGFIYRKVKAIFISHEHSDHIRRIRACQKYKLPVYITPLTCTGGLILNDGLGFGVYS